VGVANPQSWGRGGCRLSNSHSSYVTVQNGHLEHRNAAAEIKHLHVCRVYYSVVGLKICTIQCSVISVETVLFLPPFTPCRHFWSVIFMSCNFLSCNFMSCNFMSCKLVRHFHVLQFHALQFWLSVIFTSCIFSQPMTPICWWKERLQRRLATTDSSFLVQ